MIMYIKKRKPGYQPKENKIIEQIDFSSMDDILMNCFALVHSLKDKKIMIGVFHSLAHKTCVRFINVQVMESAGGQENLKVINVSFVSTDSPDRRRMLYNKLLNQIATRL